MPDPQNWKKKYDYRFPLVLPKHHCGNCAAFSNGHCAMFDAKVKRDATCDEWVKEGEWHEVKPEAGETS